MERKSTNRQFYKACPIKDGYFAYIPEETVVKALRKWINVKDKLPECEKTVLAYVKDPNKIFDEGYRLLIMRKTPKKIYWESLDDDYGPCEDSIVYWMPLPEPPEISDAPKS